MGTNTRRSLNEADYSAIEVGELVKKTDQGKKRYALKKDGGRIFMSEDPLPGKDPGYRCPECKCIVFTVKPDYYANHWRHEAEKFCNKECSLRSGKNLTKFMRYLDPKKQQRERGILDIRLEKRGFSGWQVEQLAMINTASQSVRMTKIRLLVLTTSTVIAEYFLIWIAKYNLHLTFR